MRTDEGMTLRSSETTTPEQTSTKVVATPMPKPLVTAVVTASVGHRPSIWRRDGFSSSRPREKVCASVGSLVVAAVFSAISAPPRMP